jgi:lipopolysaccharide transport system ATP-binding protein
MSDIAIQVEKLSKWYKIGTARYRHDSIRDHLADWARSLFVRNGHSSSVSGQRSVDRGPSSVVGGPSPSVDGRSDTIWALKDVSFEIKQGEVVGFIGLNGAGKSTLLKILSRITDPTSGFAEIYGRVGSLLEVGTGFQRDLTGRENIYLNGAILGMKKTEIDRKFDEIVAFSEIEKFIDTPVKRYSSGMYVRLAFAVAAHLETEILFADEVLAVGDVEFQKKCLGKMGEVAKQGRTVLFVSHNMGSVLNLCPRAILLRSGQLVYDGPAESTIKDYLTYLSSKTAQAFDNNSERRGNGAVRIIGGRILNEVNHASSHLVAGRPASFEFRYKNITGERRGTNVMFAIYNQLGVAVSWFDFSFSHGLVERLGSGGVFTCHVPNLPLPIGHYSVNIKLEVNGEEADFVPDALVFDVDNSNFFKNGRTPQLKFCTCLIHHTWSQETEPEPEPSLTRAQ